MSPRWLVLLLMIMVLFEPGANAIGLGFTSNNGNGEKAEINFEIIKCIGEFTYNEPIRVEGPKLASLTGLDLTVPYAKKITVPLLHPTDIETGLALALRLMMDR